MDLFVAKLKNSTGVQAALLAFLLSVSAFLYIIHPAKTILLDFNLYYEAGQRFAAGVSPYLARYQIEVEDHKTFSLFYFYPPFFAWMMSFFPAFELSLAKWIWCAVNFLAWLGGGVLLGTIAFDRSKANVPQTAWLLIVLFLVFCFEPVYIGTREGQVNGIIFFFWPYFSILCREGLILRRGSVLLWRLG